MLGELGLRQIGHFFDGGEAFLHEDGGDVFVDVERLLEVLDQRLRFGFALRLGVGFRHDVQVPARELAREADVLPAAADGLREFVLGHRDIHAV